MQTKFIVLALSVVLVAICALSPGRTIASEKDDSKQARILVPGGLKHGTTDKLWKIAKSKCYELGYTVSNDDKDTGNIICTKRDYIIQVNFNGEGFLVISKHTQWGDAPGFMKKMSGLDKELSQAKLEMENALKQGAGIKD